MDFDREFANVVANAALGWYSDALTDAQLVEEIESALRRFGHSDLLLPEDVVADILAARPGIRHGG
jgi:hypothetical protein